MTKVRRDEGAYRPWPACNSMPKGIDNAPVATSPRRAAAASITPSRSSRRLGSDTESLVLARAVRRHVEHRILLNGHRTVVFR